MKKKKAYCNIKKVYCKKDYINDYHDRKYYKGKIYYIDDLELNSAVFVYLDNTRQKGLWISLFQEHFSFDNKILRQAKLERICK